MYFYGLKKIRLAYFLPYIEQTTHNQQFWKFKCASFAKLLLKAVFLF